MNYTSSVFLCWYLFVLHWINIISQELVGVLWLRQRQNIYLNTIMYICYTSYIHHFCRKFIKLLRSLLTRIDKQTKKKKSLKFLWMLLNIRICTWMESLNQAYHWSMSSYFSTCMHSCMLKRIHFKPNNDEYFFSRKQKPKFYWEYSA